MLMQDTLHVRTASIQRKIEALLLDVCSKLFDHFKQEPTAIRLFRIDRGVLSIMTIDYEFNRDQRKVTINNANSCTSMS